MKFERALFAGIFLVGIGVPSRARGADAIDACVTATRVGQEQQRAGKLRDARATFVKCDDTSCPTEVRSVCEHLLDVAEASQPSIVLAARDEEGHDLVDIDVSIDGVPVQGALEGKSMDVDPGPHDVRFSARDGRIESLRVVAHEGEKNRPVQITFRAPASTSSTKSPETSEKQADSRSPVPALTFIFGAVGIVALGTFTALAIDGQHRYDDCRDHGCASSTTDGLSLERGIAWASLGVGVVAIGAATIFFVERPTSNGSVSVGMRGSNVIFAASF